MGKLSGFKYRQIIKKLKKLGLTFDRQAALNIITNRCAHNPVWWAMPYIGQMLDSHFQVVVKFYRDRHDGVRIISRYYLLMLYHKIISLSGQVVQEFNKSTPWTYLKTGKIIQTLTVFVLFAIL